MAASGIVGLFIEAVNADGSIEVATEMRIVRFLWLYYGVPYVKAYIYTF